MWRSAFAIVAACLLSAASAVALDRAPPDAARLATQQYLDAIAATNLHARAQAVATLRTRTDALRRQALVRQTILHLLGGLPDRSSPLNVQVTNVSRQNGLRVETVIFDSLPGYRITANVFVPVGKGPFPAVMISPGHSPTGKAGDYSTAVAFARAGILAFTYDIVGEGERLQNYDQDVNASKLERPTAEHSLMAYQSLLIGGAVTRYFLNDALRGVDYLVSRSDVDPQRIGAYGCSGGGTMTAFVAALDARIKVTASACFVTTMQDLLTSVGPQDGEQSIPGFTVAGLDLPDWVELAAPRSYAIVSTTEDMFPFAGARQAYEEAKRFWGLFGAEEKLHWITGPGPHGALGPLMPEIVAFFVDRLQSHGPNPLLAVARPPRPEDVWATPSGQLSTSLGGGSFLSLMKRRADAEAAKPVAGASLADLQTQRKRLQDDIVAVTKATVRPGAPAPVVHVLSSTTTAGIRQESLAFAPIDGPSFFGMLVSPSGKIRGRMIYLDKTPLTELSKPDRRLAALAHAGWQVLALSPVGGSGEEIKSVLLGDYALFSLRALLVDRTITGLRIDQTVAALNWWTLHDRAPSPVAIYAVGTLGPTALHVAVRDDRVFRVVLQDAMASYRMAIDAPICRHLPEIALPDVLHKYDLPDLMTVIAPRPVLVIAPIDASGKPLRQDDFESLVAASRQTDKALHLPTHVVWQAYEPEKISVE